MDTDHLRYKVISLNTTLVVFISFYFGLLQDHFKLALTITFSFNRCLLARCCEFHTIAF